MKAQGIAVRRLLYAAENKLGIRQLIIENNAPFAICKSAVQRLSRSDAGRRLNPRVILIIDRDGCTDTPEEEWWTSQAFLEEICRAEIPCIFIAAASQIPRSLHLFAHKTGIPFIASAHEVRVLESRLKGLLRERINKRINMHGVLLAVFGIGVLIRGESGAGKTTLGLMLAQRGHQWIADDAVEIHRKRDMRFYARGCKQVRNLIDLKHGGLCKARSHIPGYKPLLGADLHLILQIGCDTQTTDAVNVFDGGHVENIMGIDIPCLPIPFRQDRYFDCVEIEKSILAFKKLRDIS